MSRKPRKGDIIYFDVEKQSDGKHRAINCRIEGVLARKKISGNSGGAKNIGLIFIAVVIGLFGYQSISSNTENNLPVGNDESQFHEQTYAPSNFSCDGRQHCSQMNSRAEAEYFTRNCPGTKMDGDGDGVPCENDSRF